MFKKILILIAFTSIAFMCLGCNDTEEYIDELMESYEDDNVVEEMIEAIIESKLGVPIDLTPSSPEE